MNDNLPHGYSGLGKITTFLWKETLNSDSQQFNYLSKPATIYDRTQKRLKFADGNTDPGLGQAQS